MTPPERRPGTTRLERLLEGSPYQQYLYGYPHKTAYRQLRPPRPLSEVWAQERRDALFLYVHIPFCEMRCGFCNLFTAANPIEAVVEAYVTALEREARAVREAVGRAGFARAAIGGGTPSFLDAPALRRVLALMREVLGAPLGQIPLSVELSPETVTAEKLRVLREGGADRLSIGVQSFDPAEVAAVKRPQALPVVFAALDALRATGVETLNLDLIYGIEGQTVASFCASLRTALKWAPEELYLYPLYVRPLTFLGKAARQWDDARLVLYRAGRDLLRSEGYEQVSMRMFRKRGSMRGSGVELQPPPAETRGSPGSSFNVGPSQLGVKGGAAVAPPVYHCQEDGMIGLGCGARSYTRRLHYSQEWAVASRAVRGIIDDYAARTSAELSHAHHGFELSGAEERRRHAILSLLSEGLELAAWAPRFGSELSADLPELAELEVLGLAAREGGRLVLTAAGVERSDVIGPWLHSPEVDALMHGWEER